MEEESMSVSIPISLYKKIEEKIKGTEESISDYVTRILKEILSKEKNSKVELTQEEEDKVKERLKALGYMD